ncbi:hypothetical protein, partial [Acinetobacter stercoris]|uniref:hypothetical protein n=1 Tax=Acinetobacter stercoris TaxID=2126983 RepID=UPI001BC87BBF
TIIVWRDYELENWDKLTSILFYSIVTSSVSFFICVLSFFMTSKKLIDFWWYFMAYAAGVSYLFCISLIFI